MSHLRSKPFDTYPGAPLTDARIRQYILAGRYGPVLQARELERNTDAQARTRRSTPTKPHKIIHDLADL